jgi:F-type H+-transporting ATPase subunit b
VQRLAICLSVLWCVAVAVPAWGADAPAKATGAPAATAAAGAAKPAAEAAHGDDHGDGHAGHHGVHIGEEGANASPTEFKTDLAIYTLLVFVLLVVGLRKFAWGPIASALDAREQHVASQLADAERKAVEAKQLLTQYEQQLTGAAEQVRGILEEARRDAETARSDILAQARREAQAEMDRGKREIEMAKDQALKEVAEVASRQAIEVATKLLKSHLQAGDQAQLVEQIVARFPKGPVAAN